MSLAIGHFAFGVGATTGVLLATGLDKKINNTEPIRIAGGIWAMLPDVGNFIPSLKILHNGWWADAFLLHRLIDIKLDPNDSVWISTILVIFMIITLVIFWLEREKWKKSN